MLEYAARVFPGIVEMMNAVQRGWRDDTAYPVVNGKYDSLSERWVCDDGGDGFLLEVRKRYIPCCTGRHSRPQPPCELIVS